MQSEKQIAAAQGVLGRGGVYVGAELVKAALEAALSAAESTGEVAGQQGRYWMTDEGPWSNWFDITFNTWVPEPGVREVRNIYAAPPAPSVAVKALRWKGPDSHGEYHSLDGLWGYIIRPGNGNGFWLTEIGDYFTSPEAAQAAAQSDYEARIRSALSAQVQDVAGWQPIEIAPKDGTEILMYKPRPDGTFDINNAWWDGEFFRGHGWSYAPFRPATHWMPLPAAPAKQEG